jgi:hypothetical protein
VDRNLRNKLNNSHPKKKKILKQKFGIWKRLINNHGNLVAIESRGPVQLFSTFQIFPYPPNVETIFQAFGSKLRTKNVETYYLSLLHML